MLVRVKTPPIEIEGDPVPEELIRFLCEQYKDVHIEDFDYESEADFVLVDDISWYKETYQEMHGGDVLRIRRENAGMTQQELADKIGTGRTAIAAMEGRSRPITRSMARRLQKVFPESSVNDFLRIAEV